MVILHISKRRFAGFAAIAAAIAAHDAELVAITRDVIDRGTQGTLAQALLIETEALAKRKAAGAMHWTG